MQPPSFPDDDDDKERHKGTCRLDYDCTELCSSIHTLHTYRSAHTEVYTHSFTRRILSFAHTLLANNKLLIMGCRIRMSIICWVRVRACVRSFVIGDIDTVTNCMEYMYVYYVCYPTLWSHRDNGADRALHVRVRQVQLTASYTHVSSLYASRSVVVVVLVVVGHCRIRLGIIIYLPATVHTWSF